MAVRRHDGYSWYMPFLKCAHAGDHKSEPVAWRCGGRTRASLTAWRDKRMRCSWPIGLSLDTMLPDVCSKHVHACMVKVYMSCVVSTPQTPVLDSSDQL